jgi:hypothetical protein
MDTLREKRNSIRHACDGPLTLMYTQPRSPHFEARLLNFSERGLCFSSHHPMRPGTTVLVRASPVHYRKQSEDAGFQLPTMAFAVIKWCQESRQQGLPVHTMGAVYLVPY